MDDCDVCPDVPDPTQLDVDADGRGWACDPVEELPFRITTEPSGAYAHEIYAVATPERIFTVSQHGMLVTGLTDGSDPTLSFAHGEVTQVRVGESRALFAGISPTLEVDDGIVSEPLRGIYSGAGVSIFPANAGMLFFSGTDDDRTVFGRLPPGDAPFIYGYPGGPSEFCGGEPPMFLDGGAARLLVRDELVTHAHPTGPITWAFGSGCLRRFCVYEDGTLRGYRVGDDGRSELLFDTHHPSATCAGIRSWDSHLPQDAIVTIDDHALAWAGLATAVLLVDGVERVVRSRVGAIPTVTFGATSALIAWAEETSTTYERVDLATGAAMDLGIRVYGRRFTTVRGDVFAVAGGSSDEYSATRILVADRTSVLRNAVLPGEPYGLISGEDLVVVQHGRVVEAWSPSVADPLVVASDVGGIEGRAHYDSVFVGLGRPTDSSAVALRVDGGAIVRTDLSIPGHLTPIVLWDLPEGEPARWIASTAPTPVVARIARSAGGALELRDTIPGTIAFATMEDEHSILAGIWNGSEIVVARLGSTGEILLRTTRAEVLHIGPRDTFLGIGTGSDRAVCRVRGSPTIDCWSIGEFVIAPFGLTFGSSDGVMAGVAWNDVGEWAAIRTVGSPDSAP